MSQRMPKEQRHEHLLCVAEEIVETYGAEALTLIRLAERAGVSKAVTYEHFSTREGLLAEMFQRYDKKVIDTIQRSLATQPVSLETAARTIMSAYIGCVVLSGSVYESIIAALQSYPEWNNLKLRIRDFFVEAYTNLLQPFSSASPNQLKWQIVALFGATEEIAKAVSLGEIEDNMAVDILTQLFTHGITKLVD